MSCASPVRREVGKLNVQNMEWPPFDLVLAVCLRDSWMTTRNWMGYELEVSNRFLCDTTVRLRRVIKACTVCASEHTPRRDTQHLIHSQRQEHATVTHISQRDSKALARWNHSIHNRNCLKRLPHVFWDLIPRYFHPDEMSKFSCGHPSTDRPPWNYATSFLVTVVKTLDRRLSTRTICASVTARRTRNEYRASHMTQQIE